MPYSLLLLSSCNLLSVRLQATLFLVYTFMVSVGWGAWTIGREVDGLSMEIAMELNGLSMEIAMELNGLSMEASQIGMEVHGLKVEVSEMARDVKGRLDQLNAQLDQLLQLYQQGR